MIPKNLKQSARYFSRPDIPPRNVVCSLQRKQFAIPNQKTHNARDNAASVLGSNNDVSNGADKCDIFQQGKLVYLPVRFGSNSVSALLDSGDTIKLISSKFYQTLGSDVCT